MFYVEVVLSLTVIYWVSVIVAELILTSAAERQLPCVIRVGTGYMISVIWFGAAFKFVPMHWAWIAGLILLGSYTMSRPGSDRRRQLLEVKSTTRSYAVSFVWYLLLANAFLLPLHMGLRYGPFTEGGGDVSIYADMSKYLTDRRLPAYGIKDAIYDISRFAENPLAMNPDNAESMATFDEKKGNPPDADYESYRIVNVQRFGSILSSPVAQWFFLPGNTNLPTFYGSQAFQYSCLLLSIWAFFKLYGRPIALLALIIVASSHGIASVYYNVYFVQGISLMISALVIYFAQAAKPSIFPVRAFGFCFAYVVSVYLHYVSVIVPLLFIPMAIFVISKRMPLLAEPAIANRDSYIEFVSGQADGLDKSVKALRVVTIVVFFSIVSLWLVLELTYEVTFVVPLIRGFVSWMGSTTGKIVNPFFGGNEPLLTMKWSTLFLGLLSQQHFEPLMHVPPVVQILLPWSVYFGLLSLALSAGLSIFLFWMLWKNRIADLAVRRLVVFSLAVFAFSLLVIVVHHFLAQSTLYTQAKGAQDVLVLLYVSMVVPLGATYRLLHGVVERKNWHKALAWLSGSVIGLFGLGLLALRVIYALLIAYGMGRSSILEMSYFSQAEELLRRDKDAFVLFEPRTSADTYLGIQPFVGARMLPTRYLALSKLSRMFADNKWAGSKFDFNVLGSDFITSMDVEHLWYLYAKRLRTRRLMDGLEGGEYQWVADRLTDVKDPRLLMFGYDYEAFYGERLRSSGTGDKGWYTFFRNGSALLLSPAREVGRKIEVKIEPRDAINYDAMVKEVESWTRKQEGEWMLKVNSSEGRMTLLYEVAPSQKAQLVPLARFGGEFWMNVRVDDKELKAASGNSPVSETRVTGAVAIAENMLRVGETATASWSKLSSSANDDWIGIFPLGGADQTRVIFSFTGGGIQGSMRLTIPAATAPGTYELRLYSRGTWQQIASSKPFTVAP